MTRDKRKPEKSNLPASGDALGSRMFALCFLFSKECQYPSVLTNNVLLLDLRFRDKPAGHFTVALSRSSKQEDKSLDFPRESGNLGYIYNVSGFFVFLLSTLYGY